MLGIRNDWDQPFEEAIDYFRSKEIKLSPEGWEQVWEDANAGAFTVAQVTEIDVLQDIKDALTKAQEQGWTYRQFQKEIVPELQKKGWLGKGGLNASRRYYQQTEVAETRPWLQYLAVMDSVTRKRHREMDKKVYRIDSPVWDSWYPPNGFRCRCRTRTLSDDDLKEKGIKPETKLPKGAVPDKGWNYHPGKAGMNAWKPDGKIEARPDKKINIKPSSHPKTHTEAENRLSEKFNIRSDLKGIPPELADQIEQALTDVGERYPRIVEIMNYIGTGDDPKIWDDGFGKDRGAFNKFGNNIYLNPKLWSDPGYIDMYKKMMRDGDVAGDPDKLHPMHATIIHELGHAVDAFFMTYMTGKDEAVREFKRTPRSGIGKYGARDPDEGFAEGFLIMMSEPENKWSGYVKKLSKFIEKHMQE